VPPPNGFEPDRGERPGKLRAFFALPLPDETRAALLSAAENMRRRAERFLPRWQQDDKLHLTLKFLGWVEPDAVASLWQMALSAIRACAPIEARISELSAFPSPRRAKVLFAAIADPKGAIVELAARLEAGAEALGIPRENRDFRGHVTLARLKRPGNVKSLIDAAAFSPQPARLDELRLYRSLLTPETSFYSVLERAPLGL
jgi:2'-5' RNA ligase